MLDNIKKTVLYAGLDKESFDKIKTMYYQPNRLTLMVFSALFSLLVLGFAVDTYIAGAFLRSRYVYLVSFVISFMIFAANYFVKKHVHITLFLCDMFVSVAYAMAIINGTIMDTETIALTFVVFITVVPVVFNQRPVKCISMTLAACTVFIILAVMFKSPEVIFTDVSDVAAFGILGISLNLLSSSIKAEGWYAQYNAAYANIDGLTGLLNRRAYENDIMDVDVSQTENLVYIALDVNGLKLANDTLGHSAGDELLVGASNCMRRIFSSYGKVYRVGGDEFVAIISCEKSLLERLFTDFDEEILAWTGEIVDSLSVAYGYASSEENPSAGFKELEKIADTKMYEAKDRHYEEIGLDRRGQYDAHKALCRLYTKILKINITNDTYKIISMNVSERNPEKGFSDKISTWLKQFGTFGLVHPDDLEEYLRRTDLSYMKDYFAGKRTSMHVFYRRKYDDGYRRVMMEIIPTDEFREDNLSLFLYVKDIDIYST